MLTNKDVEKITNLSPAGRVYRLKQMQANGKGISIKYAQSKTGAIRVYTDEDLQAVLNYQSRKPGRKRKS